MLLFFSILTIICGIAGYVFNTIYDYSETFGKKEKIAKMLRYPFALAAVISGFIGVCVLTFILCKYDPNIDEKLELYQEENAIIEERIAQSVNAYMTYEKNIYSDLKVESPMTLVSLYPELSSDELISAQINTYIENSKEIKQLKQEQINQEYVKWWLNFNLK